MRDAEFKMFAANGMFIAKRTTSTVEIRQCLMRMLTHGRGITFYQQSSQVHCPNVFQYVQRLRSSLA